MVGERVVQSGAAGCGKGFATCFLRVPQAAGLNCSCHAAQASKGNFQKTYYKTFYTTCRPRLYISWCTGFLSLGVQGF